jgi:hypothetical protein
LLGKKEKKEKKKIWSKRKARCLGLQLRIRNFLGAVSVVAVLQQQVQTGVRSANTSAKLKQVTVPTHGQAQKKKQLD